MQCLHHLHNPGHIIATDSRDDRDIEKQFRRQNAVGNMLVRKFLRDNLEVLSHFNLLIRNGLLMNMVFSAMFLISNNQIKCDLV